MCNDWKTQWHKHEHPREFARLICRVPLPGTDFHLLYTIAAGFRTDDLAAQWRMFCANVVRIDKVYKLEKVIIALRTIT